MLQHNMVLHGYMYHTCTNTCTNTCSYRCSCNREGHNQMNRNPNSYRKTPSRYTFTDTTTFSSLHQKCRGRCSCYQLYLALWAIHIKTRHINLSILILLPTIHIVLEHYITLKQLLLQYTHTYLNPVYPNK